MFWVMDLNNSRYHVEVYYWDHNISNCCGQYNISGPWATVLHVSSLKDPYQGNLEVSYELLWPPQYFGPLGYCPPPPPTPDVELPAPALRAVPAGACQGRTWQMTGPGLLPLGQVYIHIYIYMYTYICMYTHIVIR